MRLLIITLKERYGQRTCPCPYSFDQTFSMFESLAGMSAPVGFILLDFREHPVEFARRDFPIAEFADARDVHFQGRAAVGAGQIRVRMQRVGIAVSYKCPVFRPAPFTALG